MNRIAMNDDALEIVSGGTILPYVVQPGDNLQTIATNNVQAGQQLKIKF